jgi:uncharacterized protein
MDSAPADLAALCQACGLCCDGSLFGFVPLAPDEVAPARKNRLPVLENGRGFEQPCPSLATDDDGRLGCSIYEERPAACRRFACRLYERYRQEGGPVDERAASVRRVRALIASLQASGLPPPRFDGERSASSPAAEAYTELMRLLERDFARA